MNQKKQLPWKERKPLTEKDEHVITKELESMAAENAYGERLIKVYKKQASVI